MTNDCPFCQRIVSKDVILENDLCAAFYDGFPVTPGHTLIVPKRHVAGFFDLTDEELDAMRSLLKDVKTLLDRQFHPDGYNVGVNVGAAAGQSVFHVHLHVIPRHTGDTKNPRGGVRGVIPGKQAY